MADRSAVRQMIEFVNLRGPALNMYLKKKRMFLKEHCNFLQNN